MVRGGGRLHAACAGLATVRDVAHCPPQVHDAKPLTSACRMRCEHVPVPGAHRYQEDLVLDRPRPLLLAAWHLLGHVVPVLFAASSLARFSAPRALLGDAAAAALCLGAAFGQCTAESPTLRFCEGRLYAGVTGALCDGGGGSHWTLGGVLWALVLVSAALYAVLLPLWCWLRHSDRRHVLRGRRGGFVPPYTATKESFAGAFHVVVRKLPQCHAWALGLVEDVHPDLSVTVKWRWWLDLDAEASLNAPPLRTHHRRARNIYVSPCQSAPVAEVSPVAGVLDRCVQAVACVLRIVEQCACAHFRDF